MFIFWLVADCQNSLATAGAPRGAGRSRVLEVIGRVYRSAGQWSRQRIWVIFVRRLSTLPRFGTLQDPIELQPGDQTDIGTSPPSCMLFPAHLRCDPDLISKARAEKTCALFERQHPARARLGRQS